MNFYTEPPKRCSVCRNQKFHKTETRIQVFDDIVDGEPRKVEVKRQRYRCPNCLTKVWDKVHGACSYRRKTYTFMEREQSIRSLNERNNY
ncbi:hypothetical protein EEL32_12355 [Brevibacillus laterosporus]|uniref:Uncharacterized protein n=1 Tax=Brevibacillus laterosporus TaxID=1465 RepID=A0A502HDS2_BRELA|nr:hypothetical protein EEL30_13290 [Brevibacillus laterosporus]TPG72929.1 hypothetical protein EEL31_00620 [Brevibacillus laterosporus]TPG86887.1 hypothetical protein EEL32_12355 [Brevibacillus laterosporus]